MLRRGNGRAAPETSDRYLKCEMREDLESRGVSLTEEDVT
jgi:hypothetical protein